MADAPSPQTPPPTRGGLRFGQISELTVIVPLKAGKDGAPRLREILAGGTFSGADAVGTVNQADKMPLVTDAFKSGAIGTENLVGQQDSSGLNVEAVPVRYRNDVVAVLTHQTALAARKASPLESAYLDCAGELSEIDIECAARNAPISLSILARHGLPSVE